MQVTRCELRSERVGGSQQLTSRVVRARHCGFADLLEGDALRLATKAALMLPPVPLLPMGMAIRRLANSHWCACMEAMCVPEMWRVGRSRAFACRYTPLSFRVVWVT